MSERTRAVARVLVTLEIDASGAWGPDCTLDQVRKQASESAIGALRAGLVINGIRNNGDTHAIIVGQPKVSAIIVGEEK